VGGIVSGLCPVTGSEISGVELLVLLPKTWGVTLDKQAHKKLASFLYLCNTKIHAKFTE
jgi:hypothetical protein